MTFSDGFPPFYPERSSPAILGNDTIYLIYSACVLLVAILLLLPGFKSYERVLFGIHWSISLLIGGSIVACVLGAHWHVAKATTEIPFLRDKKVVLNATIGLKIGLHAFNVTLKGTRNGQSVPGVLFTERYFFLTTDEQLEKALRRGMPSPILNVVEHFSGNRISSVWPWSRRYWIVGHFSSYLLWSAFAVWIFFNILVHAVVKYGCLCLCCTGLLMIFANISFASVTRFGQPHVTVGYYSDSVALDLRFGWCFWLCLAVGILCFTWAYLIIYYEGKHPKAINAFFNIENMKEADGGYGGATEYSQEHERSSFAVAETTTPATFHSNGAFEACSSSGVATSPAKETAAAASATPPGILLRPPSGCVSPVGIPLVTVTDCSGGLAGEQ